MVHFDRARKKWPQDADVGRFREVDMNGYMALKVVLFRDGLSREALYRVYQLECACETLQQLVPHE